MMRTWTLLLTALMIGGLPLACKAQSTITLLDGSTMPAAALDVFLSDQMETLEMPGLAIAVVNDGKVVYYRTLGTRHAQHGGDIDENTTFEAASISKAVFGYYVMQLVDRKVLDLDQPLYTYLPNYDLDHDPRYKQITARHVLTHQTGLPNWRYASETSLFLV